MRLHAPAQYDNTVRFNHLGPVQLLP